VRNRALLVSATLVVLIAIVSTFLVWRWAVESWQVPLTSAGFVASAQVLIAAIGLWIVGFVVIKTATQWGALPIRLQDDIAGHIYRLIAGQVAGEVWVLGRAALSGVSFTLTGHQLPISGAEIAALTVLVSFVALRSLRQSITQGNLAKSLGYFAVFVGLVSVAIIPMVLRELPRTVALSSDPDQHAFWASQVLRLGGIPWDQGMLGIGPFGYPAGFAALNAIWALLSGRTPVEIVTIQPQLQFLLAMLLLGAGSNRLLSRAISTPGTTTTRTSAQTLLVSLVCCATYWFILPYGLQNTYYHSAGAARCSTTLLSSVVIMGWLAFPARYLDTRTRLLRLGILGATVVVIATFNPISAAIPGVLAGSVALYESLTFVSDWIRKRQPRVPFACFPTLAAFLVFLVLGDPYYGDAALALARARLGDVACGHTANVAQVSALTWSIPSESVLEWLYPPRIFSLLFAGNLQPGALNIANELCIGALMLAWLIRAPGYTLRYGMLLVFASLSSYASHGFPSSGNADNPLYLVKPYLAWSCLQHGALLGFLFLSVLLHLLLVRLTAGRLVVTSLATILIGVYYPQPAVAANSFFKMTPRVSYCGAGGCVTAADQAVLGFIKKFGDELLSRYDHLTYQAAPKILILGSPAVLGVERWVFPSGASRVLPLVSPLPVAFFYGRGSPAWSYENYRHYVCLQFNEGWLHQKNIRYLFIPSTKEGCLRGRNRVLEKSTILFQDGDALFAQLY